LNQASRGHVKRFVDASRRALTNTGDEQVLMLSRPLRFDGPPVPPSPVRVERLEILSDQTAELVDFLLNLPEAAPAVVQLPHDPVVDFVEILQFGDRRLLPLPAR
jgi:hypothetical protein